MLWKSAVCLLAMVEWDMVVGEEVIWCGDVIIVSIRGNQMFFAGVDTSVPERLSHVDTCWLGMCVIRKSCANHIWITTTLVHGCKEGVYL